MSDALIIFLILYAAVMATVCAFVAKQKCRNAGDWFVVGALLGIIALIALAALPAKTEQAPMTNVPWRCPQCGYVNPYWEGICKCGWKRSLHATKRADKLCSACGKAVPGESNFCPACGVRIAPEYTCAKCGRTVPEGAAFCPSCGNNVLANENDQAAK
jgi:RNA polymerase subunit RPABC4/transcription elongation factor Spt4